MIKPHIILAFGWILFCFFHSLFASVLVKKRLFRTLKNHYPFYRLYYSLFSFLTLGALLFYQFSLPSPLLYLPLLWVKISGGLLLFSGLSLMAVCIRKYFGQLSGLRTLFVDEHKTGNHLLITGIHRYVRHPLYLGTFLFIWGLFLLFPFVSLLIANLIITIYTLIGIRLEEGKLIQEFGDAYREYRKKVPMLVPVWASAVFRRAKDTRPK